MSIDLSVRLERPVGASEIRDAISDTLRRLKFRGAPRITIRESLRDDTELAPEQEIGTRPALYLLGYLAGGDQVAIIVTEDDDDERIIVTFSVGASREPTEYVLGLAGAMAAAGLGEGVVEDQSLFWGLGETFHPSNVPENDSPVDISFAESCHRFLERIGQG